MKQNQKGKISKQPSPQRNIAFSFQYLTDDKEYSTKGMRHGEKGALLEELMDKLKQLSGMTFTDAMLLPKGIGGETIPQGDLSKALQNICNECEALGENEKVTVFRFNHQQCRIICTNGATDKNVIYIIALDLRYSAYDHG